MRKGIESERAWRGCEGEVRWERWAGLGGLPQGVRMPLKVQRAPVEGFHTGMLGFIRREEIRTRNQIFHCRHVVK